MTVSINDYRDAVALRISQLALPLTVAITTKPAPMITAESVADVAAITVNGAEQTFDRTSRGDARKRPTIVVGLHRKLPADATGQPDAVVFDQCSAAVESLAELLMSEFPSTPLFVVEAIEQPVFYVRDSLQQKGLFQSALYLRFAGTDFEVTTT